MIAGIAHRLLRCGSRKPNLGTRKISTVAWADNVARHANSVQSYISNTHDPYLNLSIEHYLLENAPATSVILFLYVNRPCIVIGRNQNPWLEVNINALEATRSKNSQSDHSSRLGRVDLVRRRSGGGTVFHDYGNVNWTVICPSKIFTRDKHAEMIVRALRKLGVDRTRVNERHDIVLDQGTIQTWSDASDLHRTPWTADETSGPRPLKVSGSAYKLTRGRALHHGTCLLSTPNLDLIPHFLHSPSRPYIKAKGVESVSSPVGNLDLSIAAFQEAVRHEFIKLYLTDGQSMVEEELGTDVLQNPNIQRGCDELHSPQWMFDQTPQFTFSTKIAREQREYSTNAPMGVDIQLDARYGRLTAFNIAFANGQVDSSKTEILQKQAIGRYLRDVWTWTELFSEINGLQVTDAGRWLDHMLPTAMARRIL